MSLEKFIKELGLLYEIAKKQQNVAQSLKILERIYRLGKKLEDKGTEE